MKQALLKQALLKQALLKHRVYKEHSSIMYAYRWSWLLKHIKYACDLKLGCIFEWLTLVIHLPCDITKYLKSTGPWCHLTLVVVPTVTFLGKAPNLFHRQSPTLEQSVVTFAYILEGMWQLCALEYIVVKAKLVKNFCPWHFCMIVASLGITNCYKYSIQCCMLI